MRHAIPSGNDQKINTSFDSFEHIKFMQKSNEVHGEVVRRVEQAHLCQL